MNDNLKLAPGSAQQEIIEKIKIDASQPASVFSSVSSSRTGVDKTDTCTKIVTKAHQLKVPE